jgi:hypothetical protein
MAGGVNYSIRAIAWGNGKFLAATAGQFLGAKVCSLTE